MMRIAQNRAHKRALKQALIDQNRGLFAIIHKFNGFHLALILFALSISIILLFVGTFAYFHVHITKQTSDSSSIYTNILQTLNINTNDFEILAKFDSNNAFKQQNRSALSVMFIASVSILFETALLCSVLFEHSKLGLYTVAMMFAAFVHHFYIRKTFQQTNETLSLSFIFQVLLFISSCMFLLAIRLKYYVASRTLSTRCYDMELLNTVSHKTTDP